MSEHPAARASTGKVVAIAIVVDVFWVLCFAFAGQDTHESGNGVATLLRIAWPFLVGLAVGWLIVTARRLPALQVWPSGVTVLVITYVVGMALRGLSGRGLAPTFLIVAACFLTLTMLGWRFVVTAKLHYRARRGRDLS